MPKSKTITEFENAPDTREAAISAAHGLLKEVEFQPEVKFVLSIYNSKTEETSTIGRGGELDSLTIATSLLVNLLDAGHDELEPIIAMLGAIIASATVEGGHDVH